MKNLTDELLESKNEAFDPFAVFDGIIAEVEATSQRTGEMLLILTNRINLLEKQVIHLLSKDEQGKEWLKSISEAVEKETAQKDEK